MSGKYRLAERTLIRVVNEGRWRIDADGRIWQVRIWTGRVLAVPKRAEKPLPAGYLMVRATIDGRRAVGLAHRLVWQHHRGDIAPGNEINHRNGWKADNRLSNLEEVTRSGNVLHAYRTGLKEQYGERNPAVKLTDHQVVEIRLAYACGGVTMASLAGRYGVKVQHISRLIRGTRRARQLGPIQGGDQRHASARNPVTGRFLPRDPKSATKRRSFSSAQTPGITDG